MLKCLKPICYEINCSDNDIINSIMESSCFYGEFLNNSFKMQLLSQNSIFIQNGINPIFCGNVDKNGDSVTLNIKLKLNLECWLFIFIIAFILFGVIIFNIINAFLKNLNYISIIYPLIICIVFLVFICIIVNMKYSDMKFEIEKILNKDFKGKFKRII